MQLELQPPATVTGTIVLVRLSARIGILTAAATTALALLVSPSADAKLRKGYCSPSGDYCISAARSSAGDVRLRIATFSFKGRYRLCVIAPKQASGDRVQCHRFRLRREGSLYLSNVSWRNNFPNKGPGTYRVNWSKSGSRLGPTLGFRR